MSEFDLELPGLSEDEVVALIGGVSLYQMQALSAQAIPKVETAGEIFAILAEKNPEAVREVLLQNRGAVHIAQMPDEMLEHLDLDIRDGRVFERTEDGDWTEVSIDAE